MDLMVPLKLPMPLQVKERRVGEEEDISWLHYDTLNYDSQCTSPVWSELEQKRILLRGKHPTHHHHHVNN